MKLFFVAMVLAMAVLTAIPATGGDYRYVTQEQFRDWLGTGKRMIIVDIQEPVDFDRQHFRDAVKTGAYPVTSEADRRKLYAAVRIAASSTSDVVIVCPRGGGGAKNTYQYLKGEGIEEQRLYILEKGMQGWPYPEITVQ